MGTHPRRSPLLVLLAACAGVLLAAAPLAPAPSAVDALGPPDLVVLHTNDVHGQVLARPATWLRDVDPLPDSGGLPRLAARLVALVREIEESGAAVVLCDGGDWFQGTPEGQVDDGLAFLRAFAAVGHDGAVVGNHEFDHGVGVLLEHLAEVDVPALLANVRMPDGTPLPGTRDHVVVERGGRRIALVGLLTTGTPSITHASTRELRWEEPSVALTRVRAALGDDVDLVIPVTHIGVDGDRALARAHPDLPLIVGGHSHTFLRSGVTEGNTLVVQAGAKASVIGRVDLWLGDEGAVLRAEAGHVELYEEPHTRNGRVDALCGELTRRAAGRMDEVVGVLGGPLEVTRQRLVNSSAGNFITDAMRDRTGADVAVHNRGGIRTALEAGPVTRRDLFMVLPFSNHVETLTLDGATVIELFRRSIEEDRRGPFEFSGVTLEVAGATGPTELLRVVLEDGTPLAPDAEVRLATNSYLAAGGDGWDVLAAAEQREVDFVLLRDLLELAFDGGARTPARDRRYRVVR
ncbi:MAG: bifunctional UDP-sugar hydrolase/5'-nucleotidase [Planctomycetota bacterium]